MCLFRVGQRIQVRVPPGYGPGSVIAVQAPGSAAPVPPPAAPASVALDVIVPGGIGPGQTFHVQYNGLQIAVQCPAGVYAGQQIRVQVPGR